jgi:5-methyltetrahydropteroyltriglutamate--homocysteine methyltransferase
MKRSTNRILTTHTGSLPRPKELAEIEQGRDQREARSNAGFDAMARHAVAEAVRRQVEAGVDIINDGEASKVAYSTYVTERLTGFDGKPPPRPQQAEAAMFPEFYADFVPAGSMMLPSLCTGPITWRGQKQVGDDIANLKAATQGVKAEDVFMTAASPGVIWHFLPNEYYPNDQSYIFAVAEAMKNEYKAITDAGFVLQLDCPDLAMSWNRGEFAGQSVDDFRKVAAMHIEALNAATEGIPAEQIRVHLCWGNTETPHVRDVPLARIIDVVFKARCGAVSFEGANPRHEHEWKVFEDVKLPDGMILIPGVIDSTTNFVEHPELVAQRIERYARLVGRENVIASSDCGFGTAAVSRTVHPSIAWVKLAAMAEGAAIATKELWA